MRRWVVLGLAVAGLALAGVFLHRAVPDPAEIWHALLEADKPWLALAAAAELASMSMFALQQRRLLRAYGGHMSFRGSLALTFARTGISIALPGGAAVSGAFAVTELRRRGVDTAAATAMTVLAGAQGLAALVLVYLGWFATVGVGAGGSALVAAGYVVGVLAAVATVLYGLRRLAERRRPAAPSGSRLRQRIDALADLFAATVRGAATLSMKDWLVGGGYAFANWVLDIACLLAVAHAFGLGVGTVPIVGAYLGVQLVRQIPLTPGGIGLVEASLLVALVAAGGTSGTAAAVVLTYRLLSSWLIAPVGLGCWVALRADAGAVRADVGAVRADAGGLSSSSHQPGGSVVSTPDPEGMRWDSGDVAPQRPPLRSSPSRRSPLPPVEAAPRAPVRATTAAERRSRAAR